MILENMVFRYTDSPNDTIRIICSNYNDIYVCYVNLYVDTCMPKLKEINAIQDELDTNKLIKIFDPYSNIINENELTQTQKDARDYKWNIINKYWSTQKYDFFECKKRNIILKEIEENYNYSLLKSKRFFTRFWQRGMNKNALLSDYRNSGGKGKQKKLGDDKIGRPKYNNIIDGSTGINSTDDVKAHFKFVLNKYYLRKDKKLSIKESYNYLLRDFYSDKYYEGGELKYKVWESNRIPTYIQFYYWLKKTINDKEIIVSKKGIKEFDLKSRPLLNNSKTETDGPGARFQIDATIADVYLVSSLSRDRIIGRPIVYAIIDVFSRVVTGLYVGLEGPSWVGAMMALDNMVSDKVEFCAKYGVKINSEQWSSIHIPDIIIADRGEFEGYSVENLINNINIKIENTSPYRGDLKGIVERRFKTINEKIKHKTPGAIQKEFRQRGDRDYRLDATLTLNEFTAFIIYLVIYHNNSVINNYPMDKEMIEDKVPPIPMKIWNWGIENKRGRLRTVDKETFRLNILPRGTASVSRSGIKFKNLYYSSKKAIDNQWFINPKVKRLEIVYDPRNINYIYILTESGYEKCYLLEPSYQYKDCILEEVIFNNELLSELKRNRVDNMNQLNIDLDSNLDKIIKRAIAEKDTTASKVSSNRKKVQGIKNNRVIEKEINRVSESFELGNSEEVNDINKIVNFPSKFNDTDSNNSKENSRLMEKLKKKRDEYREK